MKLPSIVGSIHINRPKSSCFPEQTFQTTNKELWRHFSKEWKCFFNSIALLGIQWGDAMFPFLEMEEEKSIYSLGKLRNVILLNTSWILKCAGSFPNELFRMQWKPVIPFLIQKREKTPQKQCWKGLMWSFSQIVPLVEVGTHLRVLGDADPWGNDTDQPLQSSCEESSMQYMHLEWDLFRLENCIDDLKDKKETILILPTLMKYKAEFQMPSWKFLLSFSPECLLWFLLHAVIL